MIRAAVVGLGIGLAHCAGYLESPYARLTAVCDPEPIRRKTVGGTFSQGSMLVLKPLFDPELLPRSWESIGVRSYGSLDEVLRNEEIDLVSLCTPDYTHPELGRKVLEAGKHLYLEKPLGVRLDDCKPLITAAQTSGRMVGVAYEFRRNPAILRMKEWINAGRIGQPQAFSLYHYRTPFRRDKIHMWIQKKEYSGGLLVEETCHWFDLARFLMSREVETLHCVTVDTIHPDFDFEDIAYVNGTFLGGGILQISHSLAGFDFSLIIQIQGTNGSLWCALKEDQYSSLDGGETSWYGLLSQGPVNGSPKDAEVLKFGTEVTEAKTIRDAVVEFTRSIVAGTPPFASLEDGFRSLELSLLAGQSAREGQVVPYQSLWETFIQSNSSRKHSPGIQSPGGSLSPLEATSSGGSVQVFYRGRIVFRHSPENPAFSYGYGEGLFNVYKGNFTIREQKRREFFPKEAKIVEATPDTVIVRFSGSGEAGTIELRFTLEDGLLTVQPVGFPAGTNRFSLHLPLEREEYVYGCGEQYSRFNVRGSRVPLWSEEQGVGRSPWDPMTHYMNWKHKGGGHWYSTYYPQPTFLTSSGLFFHGESRGYGIFDFRPTEKAILEFWDLPSRFTVGIESTFETALERLSRLLGRMPPLPEWTYNGIWLGVQGGKDAVEKKLQDALTGGVKVGALWAQDWEGRRITSFGKQLFWNWEYHRELYPDLPGYIQQLREKDIRFMGYINTFLALEGTLYKEAKEKNYCVKNRYGEDYYVHITTFPAAILDLTNPATTRWIKQVIHENMIGIGLSGWMADFGEYLPTDAVLFSGKPAELLHNPYPALWAQVNREAVEEAGKLGEIVFFLRAGYTGSSQYATAFWAGDQMVNFSRHDGLASVIPAALSLGICGGAIHHSDIGGYTTLGWVKRRQETFQRWAEQAVFTPIMRTHEGNRPDFNHQFNSNQETLSHLARMTRLFVALKPYHQAIQAEHVATGLPLIRPLFLHYPADPQSYTLQYQYLYGRELLVAPVLKSGVRSWNVYLPPDTWVHLWTGKVYTAGSHDLRGSLVKVEAPIGYPPVFYRKDSTWEVLFRDMARF